MTLPVAPGPAGPAHPTGTVKALARASAGSTLAAAIGHGTSLLLPLAAARLYGARESTDAFFLAFAGVLLVTTAQTGVAQASAVPFFVERLRRPGTPTRVVGGAAAGLMALGATAPLALGAVTGPLFEWLAPTVDAGLASLYFVLLAPFAALAGVTAVWSGLLAADRDYTTPAWSLSFRWLTGLAVAFAAGADRGPAALAAGLATGELLRAGLLARLARRRLPSSPLLALPWPMETGRRFGANAAAQLVGSVVLACTLLVDRMTAARLDSGQVTMLEIAERTWQAPAGLLMSGLLTVVLTEWSHGLEGEPSVRPLARRTFRTAAAMALLAAAVVAVAYPWSGAMTRILVGAGTLDGASLDALGRTFGTYLAITPVYVAALLYSRAILVLRRSDWLLAIALVQVGLKLAVNDAAAGAWGLAGIPLTTGLMYLIALGLCAWLLHARGAVEVPRAGD